VGAFASTPAPSAASSEKAIERTASSSENISKLREDIFHIHAPAAEASGTTTYTLMAKAVVPLAFLVIAQHLISLCGFFEFVLSAFVSRIFIWVVFGSNLSVGFFYLLFGCRLVYR